MMPTPGQSAIATFIDAKTFTVEGGFATQFNGDAPFVQKLATALDAGWTSASPMTPTTMAEHFDTEFNGYLTGQGLLFLGCIASAIDDETAAWAASWDSQAQVHTFAVSSVGIVGRIQECAPLWSNGAQAVAQVTADAFMSDFDQEAG